MEPQTPLRPVRKKDQKILFWVAGIVVFILLLPVFLAKKVSTMVVTSDAGQGSRDGQHVEVPPVNTQVIKLDPALNPPPPLYSDHYYETPTVATLPPLPTIRHQEGMMYAPGYYTDGGQKQLYLEQHEAY